MPDQRALADLLRLGSAQREDALLQAQLAQAQQMAQPRGRQYGTAGGAIMGGLADGLRGMVGGFRQNALQSQATDTEKGRVAARQQWLAASLRGEAPPAGAVPIEQSPQEQAAGMAAALRGTPAPAAASPAAASPAPPDALTKLAPYQAGPLLGGGAATAGTPAAPLAPLAGQTGGPMPGDALRAKLTQTAPYQTPAIERNPSAFAPDRYGVTLPTPTREMERPQRPAEAKMSAPAATPQAPGMPDLSPEQRAEFAIASGDPAMMAWGKTVLEQANLRDAMGAKQKALDAAAAADAAKQKTEGANKLFDQQRALREDFQKQPAVQQALALRTTLAKVQESAARGDPAGDMGVIYGIMKMYDPGASVMANDYANASNAAGVPDIVKGVWNKLIDGDKLSPDQRKMFAAQAQMLYKSQAAPALKLYQEYGDFARRAGMNPDDVLPDLGFDSAPKPPKVQAEGFTTKDGTHYVRQSDGTYLPE